MPVDRDKAEKIFNNAKALYGYHRAFLQLYPFRIRNDQIINRALETLNKNIGKLHQEIIELGGLVLERTDVLGEIFPVVYTSKEEPPVPYESGLMISEHFLSNYRN